MVNHFVNEPAFSKNTHKGRVAVDQVLNLHAVKHLRTILGVLARVLGVVGLEGWHSLLWRDGIGSVSR